MDDRQRRDDGDDALSVLVFQIVTGHQNREVSMARNVGLIMIKAGAEEWEQGVAMSAK